VVRERLANKEYISLSPFADPVIDFVLITALPEEREAVLRKLHGHRKLPPAKEDIRTYFQADLPVTFPDASTGVYQVIVMCLPGMGRVHAVAATADAIRRWHPRYILLIGIAGGMANRKVKIGDILISDQIVDYELQKLTSNTDPEIRWEVQRADPRLLDACNNLSDERWQKLIQISRPEPGHPVRKIGPIASGDKVIVFDQILAKYQNTWPKLVGVEMEGGGVATAAFQSVDRPGFFMVRGVSDLADANKGSSDVEKWRSYSCDIAASFAISLLKSGPVPLPEYSIQESTKRVELILEGEFSDFTSNRQQDLVHALAAILGTDPSNIRVLRVAQGSIVITIEIPDTVANLLYEITLAHDPRVLRLGIESVFVEGRKNINLSNRVDGIPDNIPRQSRDFYHASENGQHLFEWRLKGMERLSFGFYRALSVEIGEYEGYFGQLQRDYARELAGEELIFAVDFSELYDYIHPLGQNVERASINTYILNNLKNRFSLLPGAVGELITNLEKSVPRRFQKELLQKVYDHQAVADFIFGFPDAVKIEGRLVELYSLAEAQLKPVIGEMVDVLIFGDRYSPIKLVKDLLDQGKITPITGVERIHTYPDEAKLAARFIEDHLNMSRPEATENNQIDAIDFSIALLLNQSTGIQDKQYLTIYSQAENLIRACQSHEKLKWEDDYLIRDAKYLKYRTKLQDMSGSIKQRQDHVVEWLALCKELKAKMSDIVDLGDRFEHVAPMPSLKLIDLFRRFDEECRVSLRFEEAEPSIRDSEEKAKKLYDILISDGEFTGKVEDTFNVLKENLKEIQVRLGAFTPISDDTEDAQRYKANLRRWLGLDKVDTSKKDIRSGKDGKK
jgi:nucleoside phosphorylase